METTFKDEEPWLAVADDVLAGKYAKADRATIKSLIIGMRGIHHPKTAKAVVKLIGMSKKP